MKSATKVSQVENFKKLAKKSSLTAKDAKEIAKNINESMANKFRVL